MVVVTTWWKDQTGRTRSPASCWTGLTAQPASAPAPPRLALSPPSNQRKIMQNTIEVNSCGWHWKRNCPKKQKSIKIENIWRLLPSHFFSAFSCFLWKRNMQKMQEENIGYVVYIFILACKISSTRWCYSKGQASEMFKVSLESNRTSAVEMALLPLMSSRDSCSVSIWTSLDRSPPQRSHCGQLEFFCCP